MITNFSITSNLTDTIRKFAELLLTKINPLLNCLKGGGFLWAYKYFILKFKVLQQLIILPVVFLEIYNPQM